MGQTLATHQSRTTYGTINSDTETIQNNDERDNGNKIPNGGSSGYRSSASGSALPSSSNTDQYEELMKNSMTCPTCKGLGRVSRDHEDELVAIIPLKDQRLQPRRTWLVIVITIVICAVIAGLVLFFIIPRSISVLSLITDRVLAPSNVTVEEFKEPFEDPKYRLNISYEEPIALTNDNFFPVQVTRMQIDVNHAAQQHDSSLVLTLLLHYDNVSLGSETVAPRSSATIISDLSITLDSRLDINREGFNTYLIRVCMENPPVWSYITLVMNATVYYEYLGNPQRQTLSYDRHIGCYPYDDSMSTFTISQSTTALIPEAAAIKFDSQLNGTAGFNASALPDTTHG